MSARDHVIAPCQATCIICLRRNVTTTRRRGGWSNDRVLGKDNPPAHWYILLLEPSKPCHSLLMCTLPSVDTLRPAPPGWSLAEPDNNSEPVHHTGDMPPLDGMRLTWCLWVHRMGAGSGLAAGA